MERHDEWSRAYSALRAEGRGYDASTGRYSRSALRIFPRYQQLAAILIEVERFSPEDFSSLEEARMLLRVAGEGARSPYLANTHDDLVDAVVEEEREGFCAHLAALDDEILWREPALPYRRVLSAEEASRRREQLEAVFGRWYGGAPDRPCPAPCRSYALDQLPDREINRLRAIVVKRATNIYECNETDPSYLLDPAMAAITNCESVTFDQSLEWMIYASHELTLTVAGALLLDVETLLPELTAYELASWVHSR